METDLFLRLYLGLTETENWREPDAKEDRLRGGEEKKAWDDLAALTVVQQA